MDVRFETDRKPPAKSSIETFTQALLSIDGAKPCVLPLLEKLYGPSQFQPENKKLDTLDAGLRETQSETKKVRYFALQVIISLVIAIFQQSEWQLTTICTCLFHSTAENIFLSITL